MFLNGDIDEAPEKSIKDITNRIEEGDITIESLMKFNKKKLTKFLYQVTSFFA